MATEMEIKYFLYHSIIAKACSVFKPSAVVVQIWHSDTLMDTFSSMAGSASEEDAHFASALVNRMDLAICGEVFF